MMMMMIIIIILLLVNNNDTLVFPSITHTHIRQNCANE